MIPFYPLRQLRPARLTAPVLALLAAGLLTAGAAVAQEAGTAGTTPTEARPAATEAAPSPSPSQTSPSAPASEAAPSPATSTVEPTAPPAPATNDRSEPATPIVTPPAAGPAAAGPVDAPAGQSGTAPASPEPPAAPPSAVTPPDPTPATPQTPASPAPEAAAPEAAEAVPPQAFEPPATAPAAPAPASAAALPHDLSPWGMFMAADYVVKGVMIGLAFASLVTWTIWLAKALELAFARAKAARGVRRLERAESLGEVANGSGGKGGKWPKRGPVAALVAAAEIEIERSGQLSADGVKERTQVALQRIEARAGRAMARGTGLLATIGSTAPFVGLFGTVWGIMNSFIGISQANTTNLAVVAPGIAEALLATAIGLVAAIPAVIIYNVFARSIAGYRAILADASAEVLRHVSRDLDRRTLRARGQTVVGGRLEAAE